MRWLALDVESTDSEQKQAIELEQGRLNLDKIGILFFVISLNVID
jgi:hypothetical protein